VAAFCHYWGCFPDALDTLSDEMMAAMVRLMHREADAIRAAEAKMKQR
jgi:hypothetical protein